MSESAGSALTGLRVIEISNLVAGPFAARLLGDHGADVIKVELPGAPDPLRSWGQYHRAERGYFWTVHARNKRCITLDVRREPGRQLFLDLVRRADVVIESFRPGTLERWNLGYDELKLANPKVILARVSGYGQTGPFAHRVGYASIAEAHAGLRSINGYPDQPPVRMALSIGDSMAGMFAVHGILAALHARSRTGEGQVVDVALTDACLALTESMIPDYDQGAVIRQPGGTRLDKNAPSNIYQAANGQWVVIAANQDSLFRRLCAAMGSPELADDERFATHTARGENQDELDELIARWARGHEPAELVKTLDEAGVACALIATAADVVADPQFLAREMVLPHHDEGFDVDVLGPGVVPKLSATAGVVRWAGPPAPGSHNDEVFGVLLGLTPERVARLVAQRVI
ncbi:CoA transferase [Dactylosporangium sp. NPDC000555]|uniref:CaiB/BaiF CoA transferase family protein n=1 Tax=Dactylosporangium sp. NPDC000555 TaxID=3154260 RepID=UPI00331A52C0